MGQGYTRNDTINNIADGNIINAADFDGEYDAIEAAFNSSTGHSHDGTSGEGGPITVLGPAQDFIASTTDIKPKTTNTLDIGTNALKFKDLYLSGSANLGTVDIDAGAIDGTTIGASTPAAGTFTNLTANTDLTLASGATVTAILDEDAMTSDSDTALATQQSIKAYVASQIGGADELSEILSNGNTTGGNNIDVDDDDRIRVGANPDLEIYHDTASSQSRIFAAGLGDLRIGATNLRLSSTAGTETYLHGTANGAVNIYYDNAIKLGTTSTGIDVTGDIDVDDDIIMSSDGAVISMGADSEVTLTHEADTGIQAKTANGFELNLQTSENSIEATDTLGKITFNAPDEAAGGDALLDGAAIEAVAEDTFDASTNTTALVFKTNTSGAATERMRIKGDGTIVMDTQVDIDNITIDGNTISSTDTNGNIALTPNGTGEVDISKVDIDSGTIDGVTIGTNSVVTDLRVDNLKLDGNDISSTNTDGDVTITPNGTGSVDISKLKVASGAVAITSILDEDDLTSNSDTALATQQSVKAYVDAQIAGGSFGGGISAGSSTFSGDITFEDDGNSSPNGYGIVFKEASATYTTTFNKVTPTDNRIISLPDETGTVSTQAFANGAAVALAIALG